MPASGNRRCEWAASDLMAHYHDREWGVPVHNDRRLFEFLLLEGAQAGLSWETVLKKRPAYRTAFDNFNAAQIARYTPRKAKQLLANPGIIRNRLKIKAATQNARAFLAVQQEFGTFDRYIWQFVGGKPIRNRRKSLKQIPARTVESDAMSRDLKKRGFTFVGSTICYAFMQAVGMVNDHTVTCFRYGKSDPMPMTLTILGSGTNVHPTRAAAGYLVKTDELFLFDFGPRTLKNLMKAGVDRHRIRHILFSHFHADHFADFVHFFFDAVYHSKFVGKRPGLTLIGPRGTKKLFGLMLKNFPGFSAARFKTTIREVKDRTFTIGRTRITAGTVEHSKRLHCLGYRVEYGGKTLAYSGDAMDCAGLRQLCREADVAVLDCSFPTQRPGPNHMHAGDCGKVAQAAGVKRLILSHFYPVAEQYDVRQQAARHFRGRVIKGRDLMGVKI